MDDEQVRGMITEKQSNGRISCKAAFDIAEQAGIPRRKIGQIIDEMKIKIHSCQLGCFD